MSKKIVQDIIPPEERTIRRIPLPKNREPIASIEEPTKNWRRPSFSNTLKKFRGLRWLIVILIAGLIFGLLFLRSKAEIVITPKEETHNIEGNFVAERIGHIKEAESIPFEIVKLSEDLTKEATSIGEEAVERKASGEIIVYNKHSGSPQTLVANTRFETPEGLIFRTKEAISVPGMTTKNGEKIPGQIKVRVYADKAGEGYNIGLKDFTIPGFKNLPQYNNFFARSVGEMKGGFIGKVKKVDEKDLSVIQEELHTKLEQTLRENILTQVPEDFVLIPQSLNISFESLPNQESEEGGKVIVRERGLINGFILKKDVLEKTIISRILNDQEKVAVAGWKNARFLSDESAAEDLLVFDFDLEGEIKLIWTIDTEALKNDLAGQSKKSLETIFSKYSGIETAEAKIKPFWKSSFPQNAQKIKVEVISPLSNN